MDLRGNFQNLQLMSKTGLDNLKTTVLQPSVPLSQAKLRKHVLATYHRLRLGMGVIALFFPVLIPLAGWCYSVDWQDSYSAYYFGLPAVDFAQRIFPGIFPTRVFFCGLLFALGVFLILYKGFNWSEDWLLNIAGVAAICVAIFPMWYNGLYPKQDFPYQERFEFYKTLHFGAAYTLFGCMALVSWVCAKTTLDDRALAPLPSPLTWADRNPKWSSFFIAYLAPLAIPILWLRGQLPAQTATFRRNYNWIGLAMLLCPALATALTWMPGWETRWVLGAEAFGVWTFAAFWLVKSRELGLSRSEEKAIMRMNPLPGGTGVPQS